MSHLIDQTTGRDAIAFVGETPWHGLGAELQPGQDLDTWRKAAGLDWQVFDSPAFYLVPGESVCRSVHNRKTLYRSDTKAALATMSKDFHQVQPAQILDLYAQIAKAGGFQLDTAGALNEGRRVWALARVDDGANVVGEDRVRPYILLSTSYDGSSATIAKFTTVRVVCNNTLSMAIPTKGMEGPTEKDETAPGKEQVIRVPHSTEWTEKVAEQVRLQLGIVHDAFERFLVESRALAAKPMSAVEADAFVAMLLEPYYGQSAGNKQDVRNSKGYQRVIQLFNGEARGASMAGATRWGMLNAVTQLIDHERGRSDALRLESAWFGTGNAIKERARVILEGEFKVAA